MAKLVKALAVNICNIVVSIVISKIVYHEPVTVGAIRACYHNISYIPKNYQVSLRVSFSMT